MSGLNDENSLKNGWALLDDTIHLLSSQDFPVSNLGQSDDLEDTNREENVVREKVKHDADETFKKEKEEITAQQLWQDLKIPACELQEKIDDIAVQLESQVELLGTAKASIKALADESGIPLAGATGRMFSYFDRFRNGV